MTAYISNADADVYFESRYDSGLWDATSEANKTKLLATATRLIDRLNFAGDKHDEDQELEFPRDDDTEIPSDIKYACCEIAYAILSGRDPEYEAMLLAQTTASNEGGRLVNDPNIVNVAQVHSIPSQLAWNFLRPYLRDGSIITLSRVS